MCLCVWVCVCVCVCSHICTYVWHGACVEFRGNFRGIISYQQVGLTIQTQVFGLCDKSVYLWNPLDCRSHFLSQTLYCSLLFPTPTSFRPHHSNPPASALGCCDDRCLLPRTVNICMLYSILLISIFLVSVCFFKV